MDADEVDAWYDEQQEIAFSKYLESKDMKLAEPIFKEEMKQIREKYVALYEKSKEKPLKEKMLAKLTEMKSKIKKRLSK